MWKNIQSRERKMKMMIPLETSQDCTYRTLRSCPNGIYSISFWTLNECVGNIYCWIDRMIRYVHWRAPINTSSLQENPIKCTCIYIGKNLQKLETELKIPLENSKRLQMQSLWIFQWNFQFTFMFSYHAYIFDSGCVKWVTVSTQLSCILSVLELQLGITSRGGYNRKTFPISNFSKWKGIGGYLVWFSLELGKYWFFLSSHGHLELSVVRIEFSWFSQWFRNDTDNDSFALMDKNSMHIYEGTNLQDSILSSSCIAIIDD